MSDELKDIVVIYHADCSDGFGAAFAAWKKFGESASYIPQKDRNIPPEGLTDKEIYIVDFGFDMETTTKLVNENKTVIVIDHHQSAKEIVESFPQNIFDNNHSGAVLAWRFFHPDTPVPTLLTYVEDTDLWRFALPESREFSTALGQYEMVFAVWDSLATNLEQEDALINHIAKGSLLAKFEDKLINHMLKRRERVLFEGHEVWALNTSEYQSVLGNKLAELNLATEQTPIGIVYYRADGIIKISLRSIGETDVAAIAAKYNGGGHKNAAGCVVSSFSELPFSFL